MALSKQEKIIRLQRGIKSPETSDTLRKIMQADLDELLKPEPVYVAPVVKEKPKPIKKTVKKVVVKKEEPIVETPPVAPTLTQEEKDRLKAEIQQKLAKKKAKQAEEN